MKAVVATFNQEKAQVGAFSILVKSDGLFAALVSIMVLTVPDVHAAHVLGVRGGEPGVVHQEVGVHQVQVHVVDEAGRGAQVRVQLLQWVE